MAGTLVTVRTGLRLHVEERGADHDRIRPLLLLHGFTGSSQAWGEEVLEALARSRRVLAVDLPGHGRSDTPAPGDPLHIGCVVADLAHLLDRSGIEKADWLGYSMGGRIALAGALTRPGRVARLILESASPGLDDAAEREERRVSDEALAARIEALGVEAFVDEWLAQPLFATQARLPDEVREGERRRRLSNRPEALAACLRGLGTGTQPSFWERLPERRSPTLLITGEHDTRFTGIAARMLPGLAAMPGAQHVIVPGAGHAVHLEAPDAWLAAVISFLETI